jgi:hypothetical protein
VIHVPGPAHNDVAELAILVERGPLCVAGVWDWAEKRRRHGLFFIYLIRSHAGIPFGPFYADFGLAERDMKKVLKAFPRGFWDQALDWIARQKSFQDWVEKNMGKSGDLIGAEWAREEDDGNSN